MQAESDRLRRAAALIDDLSPDVALRMEKLARDGELEHVVGIHPSVMATVVEVWRGEHLRVLRAAIETVPRALGLLVQLPAFGTQGALKLYRRLGVTTTDELATAINEGLLADIFEPRVARAARQALEALRTREALLPLGRAYDIGAGVAAALRNDCEEARDVTLVGAVRRFEPTAGAVAVLVSSEAPAEVVRTAVQMPWVGRVLHQGSQTASLQIHEAQVNVRVVPAAEYPFALVYYTGSDAHINALRARAAALGLTLSSAGLLDSRTRTLRPCASEVEVYEALGLPFIVPELRHGDGEIEAATKGRLPVLVTERHIRGDLHMHTNWSDGRDSIETMVESARLLGYEYIAITDHSPSAAASRVLTIDRLREQRDEIERLRERVRDVAILHGAEVDILPDGRLDFPDSELEQLDVVMASLHDPAGQSGDRLTRRMVAAMRHPLVSVITHPANRIVGRRTGYPLDFAVVFEEAAATGTCLEIDGAPLHLDLDGALARRAVAAGVTLVIDSDSHRAERLGDQMRFGVATARRGWVEPHHVLNTRPIAQVKDLLARKRRRSSAL